MYKMIMTLLIAAAVLIIAGYLLFRPDISTNQKERSYLIGASYMTMNNEFYEILHEQIIFRRLPVLMNLLREKKLCYRTKMPVNRRTLPPDIFKLPHKKITF